jgi:hypothetical protein
MLTFLRTMNIVMLYVSEMSELMIGFRPSYLL